MRPVLALLFGMLIAALVAGSDARADTEKRFALIIGNDGYKSLPKLANAANDARAMDKALKAAGFETTLVLDGGRKQLNRAIEEFGDRLSSGAVGLFYYAGHGVQTEGAENYLIPVDAELDSDEDLASEALAMDRVMKIMAGAHDRLNIVILDACRDNPLPKRSRSAARGLAVVAAPTGTFVAYSAGPGQQAQDGEAGGNGLFTAELVKQIVTPGLKIEDVFKRTSEAVLGASHNKQTPWTQASIQGDFYFLPPTEGAAPPAPAAAAAAPSASGPDREALLWESVKDSQDPADFREYLKKYPKGDFAGIARNRIAALEKKAADAKPSPAPAPAAPATPAQPPKQQVATAAPAPLMEPTISLEFMEKAKAAESTNDYAAQRQWYRKAAQLGNTIAMNKLGYLLRSGLGRTAEDRTNPDKDKSEKMEALAWHEKAAERGDSDGLLSVAYFHERGITMPVDLDGAIQLYRKSVDLGSLGGMLALGRLYREGIGVKQDYGQSLQWYRKAAELGAGTAMINIAYAYDHGVGVTQDRGEAERWYAKLRSTGDHTMDVTQPNVMWLIGQQFQNGMSGIPIDTAEAAKWYEKSANMDFRPAMTSLGSLYDLGNIFDKKWTVNRVEAVRWYKKAADQGDDRAKKWLADHGEK